MACRGWRSRHFVAAALKRAEFPSGTVVGVVTLDGQTVPRGAISLIRRAASGTRDRRDTIADGRLSVRACADRQFESHVCAAGRSFA